jgi:hypothetical protein
VNDYWDFRYIPIIEIDTNSDAAATLAHEYRHHWQTYKFGKLNTPQWSNKGDYKTSIVNYFKSCPYEMDALIYEIKMAPTDYNLLWWEWLNE